MESTLWMGDIEPWMTREIILESFFEYGLKPSKIKMIKDHQFNSIKNYCFVNFDSITEANKAIISLNGKNIPKTNINFKLNWANKHCEMNRNLYVGNLPNDIDDLQLFNIFKEKYQSIHHVSIMTDNGQSKGYGFIQFTDKYDYDKCLKEMNGFIFHNNAIKVKERKKKNEDKNIEEKDINKTKINIKNNSYKINNIINNNTKINLNKRKNNKELKINENNINNYYSKKNNYYMNNPKNYYINQININNIASFYPKIKTEEDISRTDNETTFSSLEKDQDLLSSSNSNSSIHKNRKFSDNIDLLESDDEKVLNQKIQESVDKMFEHYKYTSSPGDSKYF
jgi:RNA recognition motif-containing protein